MEGNDVLELLRQDDDACREMLERLMSAADPEDWVRACMDLEAEVTLHLLAEEQALLVRLEDPASAQPTADELRRSARDVFQAMSDVMRARRPEARLVSNLRRALETHVALHAPLIGVCSMWPFERRHEAGNRFAGRKLELMELRVTADPRAAGVASRTRLRRPTGDALRPSLPS